MARRTTSAVSGALGEIKARVPTHRHGRQVAGLLKEKRADGAAGREVAEQVLVQI